ncbi:MAG: ASCH domain-containing protein [Phenylobacterium sp.]|uniref:ASCH domain-containing protein n=1 Tax=Phenylobacterium sp. TaxID=1871053 RepID=UPI0025FDD15E|nr:ASCH domain-containing protein [Phenylobacterium sp.]MBA4013090.1 ASCH domain-containing protein [Phenylobacterium sp.]
MSAARDALEHFAFGDSPATADELLALVLQGKKTATCWAASQGLKGSAPNARYVVLDSAGAPRAVIESTELVQRRFDEVPADFAAEEGEGDLSRAHWAAVHEDCFTREGTFAPDMALWCERFRLVEIIGEGADQ